MHYIRRISMVLLVILISTACLKGKLPDRIFEVISGKQLKAEPIEGGYKVRVPEFGQMALVVIT